MCLPFFPQINVFELVTIVTISTVLTLVFDIPLREVRSLLSSIELFKAKDKEPSSEVIKDESKEEQELPFPKNSTVPKESNSESRANSKITVWETRDSLERTSSRGEDVEEVIAENKTEYVEEEDVEEEDDEPISGGNAVREEESGNIWGSDRQGRFK